MELTYISGGQRSGKSSYAQKIALEMTSTPIYLATARIWDDDFAKRILRHQADRDERWTTIEKDKEISSVCAAVSANGGQPTIVLDCITLWVTNFFSDNQGDVEKSMAEISEEWERMRGLPIKLLAVSNEIGMGVMPENELARKFADLQGFVNQMVASDAQHQILMVSGTPVKIDTT